jgi:spermidine synthase
VLSLFAVTLFVSAFLLFWVQLMVAKMLLPLLGGSPSVWNTCQFFFQAVLLSGYGYAYLVAQKLGRRSQTLLQVGLLLSPLPLLPIALHQHLLPAEMETPIPWLLLILGLGAGLPFFVVATSAPLLQQWFAQSAHPDSADPYFLYSASNLGSMLGLLSYPLLIEPHFSLTEQTWGWAIAYLLLFILTLGCGVVYWRSDPGALPLPPVDRPSEPLPDWQQQVRWVVLAGLPSSLLLGTTTYLTTDIAAIPLLWALPLALYLLSFILTFARRPLVSPLKIAPWLPLLITPLILLLLLKVTQPLLIVLPLHLFGLFLVAYVLHGQLAQTRPHPQYLTRFYLLIALGGAIGGVFNAILAPLIFSTVLEYPLALLSVLLIFPSIAVIPEKSRLRGTFSLCVGVLLGALLIGFSAQGWQQHLTGNGIALLLLGAIAVSFHFSPLRWAIGGLLIILLGQFSLSSLGGVLTTDRSFFGVYQILEDRKSNYHTLLHGTTVHGRQSLDPARQREPLTYFTRSGPVGQVFASLNQQAKLSRVAVLGLGVGTLAAYAQPQQEWTFYEIDPLVVKLAQEKQFFSFLADSKATTKIVLGDARLRLEATPDQYYDLIVMDAFSSDAIPVHLVTQEAMQIYLRKLATGGLIVVNITNRYLDLEPVLAALAQDLGLTALKRDHRDISAPELTAGTAASRWIALARQSEDLASLSKDYGWQAIASPANFPLWTDDFSNLLQVIRKN